MSTVLELYEKLKPKLGEDEARALLEFVETSVQDKAATKDDLERTASALRDEIRRNEAALRKEIQEIKVDLLKWSFAFWLGAVAVLSGIMLALLRAFAGK